MIPHTALLVAVLAFAPATRVIGDRASSAVPRADAFAHREVARLQAHFDSVDVELRARPTTSLTAAQRAARQDLIHWLRDYRMAAAFPRNDRFADAAMPFFRDSRGVLCAMAYLVERSGRPDLVNRIARDANNAFIGQLRDDVELRAWLDSTGLLITEAARIQPSYDFISPDVVTPNEPRHPAASMALTMASLATLAFNVKSPTRASAVTGVAAGVLGLVAGAGQLDTDGYGRSFAIATMSAGAGALAMAATRLFRGDAVVRRTAEGQASAARTVHVSPMLGVASERPRLGVLVTRRF